MDPSELSTDSPEVNKLLQAIGEFIGLDDNKPTDSYLLRESEAMAVIAAIASGRALVVRGEPGCGKSELAVAVARLIDRHLVSTTIQPSTESSDLLWSIDHTQRLADAQRGSPTDCMQKYLCAGPVWWALEPESASTMQGEAGYQPGQHNDATQIDPRNTVLLVDEIDKGAGVRIADGLLEVLGHGSFRVPPLGLSVGANNNSRSPLIIFTSNNTRDLPPAFLRRCVVLDCELPDDPTEHFCLIGAHRHPTLAVKAVREAARQINSDRMASELPPRAGMAEYLDLLRALELLAPNDEDAQMHWLEQLSHCFHKSVSRPL